MPNKKVPLTVSIIIPAYNEEHHIKDCLDSIASQTVRPQEVIVIDNNSTDATVKMAKSYKFVKVVAEPKQGIVFARNKGFNLAKSDIIGRIDADTILPPDWTEKVIDFYSEHKNRNSALTGNGYFRNMLFPPGRVNGLIQNLITFRFNRLVLGHYILWGSNMAILRSQWLKVRNYTCLDTNIHEDLDIAIHLHKIGIKIVYDPRVYVSVIMKRAFDDYRKVWPNLLWWPRTLKKHHKPLWFGGFIGAVLIQLMSFILVPINIFLIKLKDQ